MTETEQWHGGSAVRQTPLGWIAVSGEREKITAVGIAAHAPLATGSTNPVLEDAVAALAAWLEGGIWPRNLPLDPQGTVFQQRVWRELLKIPHGSTTTYGALAQKLGTGARAVGGACRCNPIPLLIPCHRVVAANGMGGFSGQTDGYWLEIKSWLLQHEQ